MNESSSWRPTASLKALQQRARIVAQLRQFFDTRGFLEVQTPCLSRDVVVDRYIQPLPVDVPGTGGPERYWLQTSPEFAMKRLLAAGATAIYQIGPVFRAAESGARHNVEFTMLEWYRTGDDYRDGIQFLDEFAQEILNRPPAQRLAWRELFVKFAGIDPDDERWSADELNELLVTRIEPRLTEIPSVIVYDWPADQAALARIDQDSTGRRIAERFELYCDGVELANGYHELTDPVELLQRNRDTNLLRQQDGNSRLPEESRLLDAMRHGLPASSGVAAGVDRLVMVALGESQIRSVLPFADDRA